MPWPGSAWITSKRCRSPRSASGPPCRPPRPGSRGDGPMYPAQFEYHTPGTLNEALALLGQFKDEAKILAGGHSLIPAMKLRLARPGHLVDLRKISSLRGIKEDGATLVIGALT